MKQLNWDHVPVRKIGCDNSILKRCLERTSNLSHCLELAELKAFKCRYLFKTVTEHCKNENSQHKKLQALIRKNYQNFRNEIQTASETFSELSLLKLRGKVSSKLKSSCIS